MGKHKPTYTPHVDTGDFVVVVNAAKIRVTGNKLQAKEYQRYSGYPGGQKSVPLSRMLAKRPETVIKLAVRRMLPKNALGEHMFKKLHVYAGPEHRHQAQQPVDMAL
jgi:large subunit ribosomal protein L13